MTNEHEKLPSGKLAEETCCASMYSGGWKIRYCSRKAKITVDGKHYCGIHDPIKKKAKSDARMKKYLDQSDARNKASAAHEKLIADGRKYAALEPLLRELCEARKLAIAAEWILSGPYQKPDALQSWEIRTPDEPNGKHDWPFRICETTRGQHSDIDKHNMTFIATAANITARIRGIVDGKT